MPTNKLPAPDRKPLYWIWWVVGPLLQIVLAWPKLRKRIHLKSFLAVSGAFVVSMSILEPLAVSQSWWIWNEERLLGPKVLGVPLEEFLLYFVAAPSVMIIQTWIRMLLNAICARKEP